MMIADSAKGSKTTISLSVSGPRRTCLARYAASTRCGRLRIPVARLCARTGLLISFCLSFVCIRRYANSFLSSPSLEPAGAKSGMYVHTPTFNLTGIEYEQTRPNPSTASTSEALFDSACSWKPTRKPSVPSCLPPRCSVLPVAQPARNRLS